ncbi:hypothetical protein SAMN02745121_05651 [Nannocystis exedens]|uniref:Uncharacterized protein n=1 Tax=Nannocystis exedens TaxID=54 RepID=A0A1I2DP57_9BACT|nr:hypothetical protein [Nannocystis exedens]PCC69016.1 hypothetical protein NAEX_02038 [Nannocystis exedens]SFE82238.1 hypothetical protein SAMN02745121_05651 [Nannocystis exedens]
MTHLPAPRSLLDRPQRLGVLPTLWFWNDAGRQWLLLPLVLATAVPVAIGVQWVVLRYPALSSPLLLLIVLYPFLLMGLVERHVRRRLVAPRPPRPAVTRPPPSLARTVPLWVAATCALLLALASSESRSALVIAALAGGSLAVALVPHTWRALDRAASGDDRPPLPPRRPS